MRVLVTGATGYIGRAVVDTLHSGGHEPIAMVRTFGATFPDGVESRTADLLDVPSLANAMAGVDAVCHLAGVVRARESWDHPLRYFDINATGTMNLLTAMEDAAVDQLVFASTGTIYGAAEQQPMAEDLPDDIPHPYAGSKRAAELAIEAQARSGRLGAVILRVFGVAGGADPDRTRIVPAVLATAAGVSPHVTVNGDGSAMRDLLHVNDVASAFVAAIDRPAPVGEARRYNVGSGTGVSVMDVVAAAERITNRAVPLVHRPPAPEPPKLIANADRAHAALGWKPIRSHLDEIVRDAWRSTAEPGE